jgi:hypothetical protein
MGLPRFKSSVNKRGLNMKKSVVLFLTMLPLSAAHASYNTDGSEKAIRCTATQTVVIVNAARTELTIIDTIDSGHPEKYAIVNRSSDGDTFVTYNTDTAGLSVSFDDQGDTLTYPGQRPLRLKCPQ